MLAVERAVVARPHLVGDAQRLLEPLEALLQRRERHAEARVLLLEPGGADAEVGAAAGQHVERGHRLDEDAGVAVGDAGDHRARA